jgi:hypothetical protein
MAPPFPTQLKHQSVFALDNAEHDGPYASDTDCLYLSIGRAQWENKHISGKTLRHNGRKWNRNSEEMPAHRILDLAVMIALAYAYTNGQNLNVDQSRIAHLVDESAAKELARQLRGDEDIRTRLNALARALAQAGFAEP